MTRVETVPGILRSPMQAYQGEIVVYSQAVGPDLVDVWLDNDLAQFNAFFDCAVSEGLAVLNLDMARAFASDGPEPLLKDYLVGDWHKAYAFAGGKQVVAQRDHRLVLRVGDARFGSVPFVPDHVRDVNSTPSVGPVAEKCRSEPLLRNANSRH